jgi:hypothetical protein
MTAQIGADGLDLFGDPYPELLTDVARAQPQPGGEWVDLEKRLGFHSTQRLRISDLAGSVLVATWPAELARQARYLYSAGLGSSGCCDRARMDSNTVTPHRVLHSIVGQTVVHASVGRSA